MAAKMTDELEITYTFFCPIIHCYNGTGYEEHVEEENLDQGMVGEAERKRSL